MDEKLADGARNKHSPGFVVRLRCSADDCQAKREMWHTSFELFRVDEAEYLKIAAPAWLG